MTAIVTLPAPVLGESFVSPRKWERERAAFLRLLPQLLANYSGKYIAIHNEVVAAYGDNKIDVALSVLKQIGNQDIFVGLVTNEPERVAHSGVRRELSSSGADR